MPAKKKKNGITTWRATTSACLKMKKAIAANAPPQPGSGALRGMAAPKRVNDSHAKKSVLITPAQGTTSAESSSSQLSGSSTSDNTSSTVVAPQGPTRPPLKKVRMAVATPDPSQEPYDSPVRKSYLLETTTNESSNPEATETSDPVDSYEALTADSMQVSEPYGTVHNAIDSQHNVHATPLRTNLPSVASTKKAREPERPQAFHGVSPCINAPGTASDALRERGYPKLAASVVAPTTLPSTTQNQPRGPSVSFSCSVGKGPYAQASHSAYRANSGTVPVRSEAPPALKEAAEACSASRPDVREQNADSMCTLTPKEHPPKQPIQLVEGWPREASAGEETAAPAGENVTVHLRARLLPACADCLLYPLAVLLFGVAVGVVFVITSPLRAPGWLKPSVCTSPACTQNAIYLSHLLSWDDMSPCDDFYMFVCRRWTNDLAEASAEESISADDDYAAALEERMHVMLRNASRASSLNVRVLGDLLEKCEDAKRIEDDGWNPFLEFMFDMSLEGFPLTPPVRQSLSVWKLAGKLLRRSGTAALLDVGVSTRPSTTSQEAITVGPPQVIGSAEGVDVNELMRLYTNAAFAAVNALRKDFVPPAYTIGVAKFAGELEKLFEARGASGSKVETLVARSPLLDFLTEALRGLPVFDEAGSDVIVLSPAFVNNVQDLVDKTEPHTVINFLCVRLMIQTSAFLPSSGLTDFYGTLLYGKLRTNVPRRHLCVRVVERTLSQFFHYASFVELNLHASATKYSDLVIETVNEFLRSIDSSPYFNSASRTAIRALVSKTRFKVLGPSWIRDNNAIERYAKNAPAFTNQRPLYTYLSLHEYAFVSTILRGPSQRWTLSAFATRCRYDHVSRSVYVPALLFNVSVPFDNRSANALHVPRVSTRLGRCLFDMLLSEMKSNDSRAGGGGDRSSDQPLNRETRLRLLEAQHCFEEHDDRQALEDLRDLLAARIAHQHFRRSATASGRGFALRLPPRGGDGEETLLSEDQLFFVFLVLQSCRRQSGDQKIVAPQHDSAGWNAVLRNYANFSDAFRCQPGSSMNPARRCT